MTLPLDHEDRLMNIDGGNEALTSHLHGDEEVIATFARDLAEAQTDTDPEFATALSKNRSDLYMKPSQNED